jgi:hypothetical protein
MPDLNDTFLAIRLLWGVGVLIGSLELLRDADDFGPRGFFSWIILREDLSTPLLRALLDRCSSVAAFRLLHVLRLAAALAVPWQPYPSPGCTLAIGIIVATTCYLHARAPFGLDGADQMSLITAVTLLLGAVVVGTPRALDLCLWFITFQLLLSYSTAGLAKLVSPTWRNGNAVVFVLDTETYGNRRLSGWLLDRSWRPAAAAWAVIIFECLFPVAFALGGPVWWIFLAGGVLMHLGIAAVMGLNLFLFAFLATYPAAIYCSLQVGRWW